MKDLTSAPVHYVSGSQIWLENGYTIDRRTKKLVGRWNERVSVFGNYISVWRGHSQNIKYLTRLYKKIQNRYDKYSQLYRAAKEKLFQQGAVAAYPIPKSPYWHVLNITYERGFYSLNHNTTLLDSPFAVNYSVGRMAVRYSDIINRIQTQLLRVKSLIIKLIVEQLPTEMPGSTDVYLPVSVDGLVFHLKGTRSYHRLSSAGSWSVHWSYADNCTVLAPVTWKHGSQPIKLVKTAV